MDLSPAARARIEQTIAASTRRAYRSALRRLADAGIDYAATSDAEIAEHLQSLIDAGRRLPTIEQAIAAVRWACRLAGCGDPIGPSCDIVVSAYRRHPGRPRPRQAVPLRWADADAMCAAAAAAGDLIGLRDAAIISVGSDAMLRRSELSALDASDVTTVVAIRSSKTDQTQIGIALWLSDRTLGRVGAWTAAAGIADGPLYRPIHPAGDRALPRRLAPASVAAVIRRRARQIGLDATGHSLRVGGAVSLAEAGAGVPEMQTAGRWVRPDLPAHYAAAELAPRTAVARYRSAES